MKHVALSVAGSDSSGGAGVQADLKSFQYVGVHGCCVLSCVTAQNTQKVTQVFQLPAELVADQLEAVFSDFSVNAAKTGMLFNAEIAGVVADSFEDHHIRPIVDPVMVATSGDSLSSKSFVSVLKERLLPQSLIVTANVPEAEALSKLSINSVDEMKQAGKKLHALGTKYVLIKGGHLPGDLVVDVLFGGKTYTQLSLPRLPKKKAHGSGCSLSAVLTGYLAGGSSVPKAVLKAKHVIWSMIEEGYAPGKGSDVLHHNPHFVLPLSVSDGEQIEVWKQLQRAVKQLESMLPASLVAEVGMNFAYAQKNATTFSDICAVEGRITTKGKQVYICGNLSFDASRHIARVVLAAMQKNPHMRSALNIRYSEQTIKRCCKKGLRIGYFNRNDEPKTSSSTMEWGTTHAIKSIGEVPDVIYDKGSTGKEPMIRILGTHPDDVLSKLKKIVK